MSIPHKLFEDIPHELAKELSTVSEKLKWISGCTMVKHSSGPYLVTSEQLDTLIKNTFKYAHGSREINRPK